MSRMIDKPTKADLHSNKVSHDEYYLSIARESGISYAGHKDLLRVKELIDSGDVHLNEIPLPMWDARAIACEAALTRVLKARGDFYTLSAGICAHKAAARFAAMTAEQL